MRVVLPTGPARYCTGLRQVATVERHGTPLTYQGKVYSQLPLDGKNQAGWFANLLRPGVTPAMMGPLQAVGVRHLGQLVTVTGKHVISTTDLSNLYGAQIKRRHQKALIQISVALSGIFPPGATKISELRSDHQLPPECRALPAGLAMPSCPEGKTLAGTLDIRTLLTKARDPPASGPKQDVMVAWRLSKKTRQEQVHARYAKDEVPVAT